MSGSEGHWRESFHDEKRRRAIQHLIKVALEIATETATENETSPFPNEFHREVTRISTITEFQCFQSATSKSDYLEKLAERIDEMRDGENPLLTAAVSEMVSPIGPIPQAGSSDVAGRSAQDKGVETERAVAPALSLSTSGEVQTTQASAAASISQKDKRTLPRRSIGGLLLGSGSQSAAEADHGKNQSSVAGSRDFKAAAREENDLSTKGKASLIAGREGGPSIAAETDASAIWRRIQDLQRKYKEPFMIARAALLQIAKSDPKEKENLQKVVEDIKLPYHILNIEGVHKVPSEMKPAYLDNTEELVTQLLRTPCIRNFLIKSRSNTQRESAGLVPKAAATAPAQNNLHKLTQTQPEAGGPSKDEKSKYTAPGESRRAQQHIVGSNSHVSGLSREERIQDIKGGSSNSMAKKSEVPSIADKDVNRIWARIKTLQGRYKVNFSATYAILMKEAEEAQSSNSHDSKSLRIILKDAKHAYYVLSIASADKIPPKLRFEHVERTEQIITRTFKNGQVKNIVTKAQLRGRLQEMQRAYKKRMEELLRITDQTQEHQLPSTKSAHTGKLSKEFVQKLASCCKCLKAESAEKIEEELDISTLEGFENFILQRAIPLYNSLFENSPPACLEPQNKNDADPRNQEQIQSSEQQNLRTPHARLSRPPLQQSLRGRQPGQPSSSRALPQYRKSSGGQALEVGASKEGRPGFPVMKRRGKEVEETKSLDGAGPSQENVLPSKSPDVAQTPSPPRGRSSSPR